MAVASTTASVITDNNVKVDYGIDLQNVTTADYSYTAELRLYRDGTLIDTRTSSFSGSVAATQNTAIANTYVDTAPATTTSTYQLRVIYTAATNITSASVINRNLNLIVFQ
ncbi:hypothetical protein [Hungatella xylanolytica]|uniref:hypothetical protein n=1 Tax=Lacrimispora xylanisolvens TaxID=384636 RepID=UPI001FA89809|nr:hypothetical protein [Hungatella xylanolytica]